MFVKKQALTLVIAIDPLWRKGATERTLLPPLWNKRRCHPRPLRGTGAFLCPVGCVKCSVPNKVQSIADRLIRNNLKYLIHASASTDVVVGSGKASYRKGGDKHQVRDEPSKAQL